MSLGPQLSDTVSWTGGDLLNQTLSHTLFHSAGIGRTGTFIVIDILIDVIREKGESARTHTHVHTQTNKQTNTHT